METTKKHMSTNEYSIAFSEVLDVLQHSEIEVIEKIPLEIIKKIKEKTCKEYIPREKNDCNFNISEKAKSILAVIYQDYLCDDEEIDEFNQLLLDNEAEYQEQLREKYNPDTLFKNKRASVESSNNAENMQMIEYKDSAFKKIINRIKKLFIGKNSC